jgi:hypothetical protein
MTRQELFNKYAELNEAESKNWDGLLMTYSEFCLALSEVLAKQRESDISLILNYIYAGVECPEFKSISDFIRNDKLED